VLPSTSSSGATGGIGHAIAQRLRAEGTGLVLTGRRVEPHFRLRGFCELARFRLRVTASGLGLSFTHPLALFLSDLLAHA